MSDLQDAFKWYEEWHGDCESLSIPNVTVLAIAARRVVNPDLDLAVRFDTLRIGGPTADGRVHLNGSLSNDEWGRLQAALGFTEDTE